MFSHLIHSIQSVSTITAKIVVGGTGAIVGGSAGLVAGAVVGVTYGTVAGCKAGTQMALSLVWPDHEEGSHEAEELAKTTAADIRAEIKAIEVEMRDLAGPAKPAKRGPGRPKKQTSCYGPGWESIETATIKIDGRELDDQEVRDFLSGKGHLRPDPIF